MKGSDDTEKHKIAFDCLQRASSNGYARAMLKLAIMLITGDRLPKGMWLLFDVYFSNKRGLHVSAFVKLSVIVFMTINEFTFVCHLQAWCGDCLLYFPPNRLF